MSLKIFHLLFVTVSSIFGVGFGLWALQEFRRTSETSLLVTAISSFVAALALVVYGCWFMRKIGGMNGADRP